MNQKCWYHHCIGLPLSFCIAGAERRKMNVAEGGANIRLYCGPCGLTYQSWSHPWRTYECCVPCRCWWTKSYPATSSSTLPLMRYIGNIIKHASESINLRNTTRYSEGQFAFIHHSSAGQQQRGNVSRPAERGRGAGVLGVVIENMVWHCEDTWLCDCVAAWQLLLVYVFAHFMPALITGTRNKKHAYTVPTVLSNTHTYNLQGTAQRQQTTV